MTLPRLAASLGMIIGVTAAVAQAQAPAAATAPAVRGPHDRAEIEAFIDGLMTSYLRDKHIAGATVSLVRDTSLLFSKGYGYADVANQVRVDPARTMFRNGSITKTFTWTAVMQLVEQGKLDLDKDINTYLDFRIPETYTEPITLRHVLTHTPGLEEDSRELFTDDPARIRPMKEWLPSHMPSRVRPPGTYSAYSNWASATAGYVVERVSGMPYDQYVEQHIFNPLGMASASTRQPLPAALEPQMSKGYTWTNGRWEPKKFEIITGAWPAGSMSVSANDMASFMIAHLNHGAYRGQRILAESTSMRMQTRLQGHDPRLPGFAHGFYEQATGGVRAIGHGGDTQWFHSDMMLLPTERVGVFVSFNTDTGGEVSFKPFTDDFLAHYYPDPLPYLAPTRDDREANQRFAGEYLMNRMSYSTFQKAFSLASAVKISVSDSGALVATTPLGTLRLVQVDSLLFRDVASQDLVAFKADAEGKITHGYLSLLPMGTLEKASGLGAPSLHLAVLGLGVAMFGCIFIAALVGLFRKRSVRPGPEDSLVKRGRLLLLVAALLVVAFVIVTAVLAGDMEKMLMHGELGAVKAALVLPVLAAIATLGTVVVLVFQWMRNAGTRGTRLRQSLAVVIALLFFWSLNTWNLLGWKF
ncbi:MAG: serine hydrolase domain-containing protein [Gemmatimonadaceae bacterium]